MMAAVMWIYRRTAGQTFLLLLGLWAGLYLVLFVGVGVWSGGDAGSWLTLWPLSVSSRVASLVSLVLIWRRWVVRRRIGRSARRA